MAKATITEVEILRFFEAESLDKATVLFNIISDKMRARLHGDNPEPPLFAPRTPAIQKRKKRRRAIADADTWRRVTCVRQNAV